MPVSDLADRSPIGEPEALALASSVLGRSVGRASDIERVPLDYDAFLAGRSLARISGTAAVDGVPTRWSAIEKVTERPGVASAYLYDNGLREFRAYESGILANLAPGLSAPASYRCEEAADGTLTLWLEDLGSRRPWEPEHYLNAARHLGRLAGRWVDRTLDHPWLFREWIDRHSQPGAKARGLEILRAGQGRPEVEERIGFDVAEAIRVVEEQPRYRSLLESLPATLCHHDAVAANLFARDGETVAIDWEMLGIGPIGTDLASLLFSSVRRGDLAVAAYPGLEPLAMEAYLAGLRDTSASIDPTKVRVGFDAAIALRWSLARDVVAAVVDGTAVHRGSAPDEPPDQALDELIALTEVLFEAARRLA